MTDDPYPEESERLVALMGLAASERQGIGSCPSTEQLAAFVDRRLKGQARQRLLAHLDRCPQCYHHWLEIGAYLQEATPATKSRLQPLAAFRERLNFAFAYRRLAISIAAALALVSIVVLWPSTPDLHQRVSHQFTLLSTQGATRPPLVKGDLPLPWEGVALGFNEAATTPARQAFGAGLWSGRQALLMDRTGVLPEALSPPAGRSWADSDWKPYYEFGRWTVLMWAQARSCQTTQQWSSHRAIFELLRGDFEKRAAHAASAQPFVAALARLDPLLENAARQGDHQTYRCLSRHLMIMMNILGPSNL